MNHARLVIWDEGECRRVYEAALAVPARKHHRSFWRASLFDHTVYDRWAANGSQTMGERLKAKVAELRAQPREFVIDVEMRSQLDRIAAVAEEEYQAVGA